jgi:hypothetical protein
MNWIKNPAGYCRYHNKKMSARQIKAKECLCKTNNNKKCRHLRVFREHPCWEQRKAKLYQFGGVKAIL